MPAVGALDDPAPGLALDASDQGRLATSPRVSVDAALLDPLVDDLVVVALVEADVRGTEARAGDVVGDAVERRHCHLHVGDVGAAHGDAERDTSLIREDVPLGAGFGAIRRVWPGVVAALGRLDDDAVERRPIPGDAAHLIVEPQHGAHDPLEDPALDPLGEAAVTGRAGAELRRQRLPLAARP